MVPSPYPIPLQLVNEIDQDRSGEIDKEEFGEAVSALHADLTEAAGRGSRLKIVVFVISLWTLLGMVIFTLTEDWELQTSFYFSFVTLATIGLGDFFPTTQIGQIFLIIFIAGGLGMLSVLLTLLEGMMKDAEAVRQLAAEKSRQNHVDAKRLKESPQEVKEVEREVAAAARGEKEEKQERKELTATAASTKCADTNRSDKLTMTGSKVESEEEKKKIQERVQKKGKRETTKANNDNDEEENIVRKEQRRSMVVVVVDEEAESRVKEVVAEETEDDSPPAPKRRLSPKTSLKTWGTGSF